MRERRRGEPRGLRALAPLVPILLVLLPACSRGAAEQPSQAPASSRPVTFQAADGLRLEGRLFGTPPSEGSGGVVGVVLSHMLPADQRSWWGFADRLSSGGYLALTYDFRGYCPGGDAGCSAGKKQVAAIWQDVLGAAAFLRSEGATQLVLVGASMGGTASLVAATRMEQQPTAVITLSAPTSIEGLNADAAVLQQVSGAKLFVAGEFDTVAADSAQAFSDGSPPPKRLQIYPTDEHGTDLLTGNLGGQVETLMLTFIDEFTQA